MLRSMFTGVSGLENHQARMDVIANNISNVNTIGFKKGRANFQDILSQTLSGAGSPTATVGGTNPKQIGLGMTLGSIDNIFTQGALQTTGNNTDMAIQGNGMFILSDGSLTNYSRNGQFSVDANGTLVNAANGWNVQGWQADVTGAINSALGPTNISIPIGSTIAANATANVDYGYNLDATTDGTLTTNTNTQTVTDSGGAGTTTINWTFTPTGNFDQWTVNGVLSGGAVWGSSGTNTLTYTATVNNTTGVVTADTGPGATDTIDINGGGADVTMNLLNTGDVLNGVANNISVVGPDTVDRNISATFASAPTHSAAINVYDSLGNTHPVTITLTKTGNNTWSWLASGIGVTAGSGTLAFNPDGSLSASVLTAAVAITTPPAANVSFTPNFTNATQYASNNTLIAQSQDGFASGSLLSFTVGNDGTITGAYSNGIRRDMAQVALAHFTNYQGLVKEGENMFSQSNNSGIPMVGTANSGGRGSIAAGELEMSNVDLAEEFTNMIITERGFQANSKSITTSDEMLQELLSLKR